jgi:hypothetical protein
VNFEEEFQVWLEKALKCDLPNEIKAFSFNLFEPALIDGVKFGVEIIGAGEFDANDPDWACDEVWEPEQRKLNIPIEYSGDSWQMCLEKVTKLVADTLQKNVNLAAKLKESMGVGVGFVDGDLKIVWQP